MMSPIHLGDYDITNFGYDKRSIQDVSVQDKNVRVSDTYPIQVRLLRSIGATYKETKEKDPCHKQPHHSSTSGEKGG